MQGKIDTDVRNRHSDSGRRLRAGRCERTPAEPCLLPYVKQMTGASPTLEAGTQSRCSGQARRKGGDGGAGSGWGTHTPLADSCRF